jgi:hypothetical protein
VWLDPKNFNTPKENPPVQKQRRLTHEDLTVCQVAGHNEEEILVSKHGIHRQYIEELLL